MDEIGTVGRDEQNAEGVRIMEVQKIYIDQREARELWRAYQKHTHWSKPIDEEIRRAYKQIAQGRTVIQAIESIKQAGLSENGCPRLAIVRADAEKCYFTRQHSGAARFSAVNGWRMNHWHRHHIELPQGTFPPGTWRDHWNAAEAIVPLVPVHLRPKRGLANYHILWEAEWTRIVPRDPMLLRRLGKGDLWLVVAAWDLTEVEQAALAARVSVT